MTSIEKIHAEINRLMKEIDNEYHGWLDNYDQEIGYKSALDDLNSFIDSLKDEPVHYTKRNELFDKCVANIDPNTLKEVEEQVDKELKDDPNEYLKQEAESYWKKQGGGSHVQWDKFVKVVKHFTEWQKDQDKEAIEVAEDHAMLAGRMQMKEEMMKDAVDAHIIMSCNSVSEPRENSHMVELFYNQKDNTPYLVAGRTVKFLIIE